MEEVIRIGMAEFAVAHAPTKITTLGLGSCIGLSIYDPIIKVGGMIHIMLPSKLIATGSDNPAKFADTGVPLLLKEIERLGALKSRLLVKIVGGAEMFKMDGQDDRVRIGARNIQAVETVCEQLGLVIVASSVGGDIGKSITLDLESGLVYVRMVSGTIHL
jgi:chemotaxis protein CheD